MLLLVVMFHRYIRRYSPTDFDMSSPIMVSLISDDESSGVFSRLMM